MRATLSQARRLRLRFGDGTTIYDPLRSLTLSRGGSGGPALGETYSAGITLQTAEPGHTLENEQATLEGSQDGTDWHPVGVFWLGTPERGDWVVSVSGYDAMAARLEKTAYTQPESPPTTAKGYLAQVSALTGVSLSEEMASWTDAAAGEVELAEGTDCRTVAGWAAALLGGNAMMDAAGALTVRWYQDCGLTITPEGYYDGGFRRKEELWTVTGLQAEVGAEAALFAGDPEGGCVLRLACPLMTVDRLNQLWTQLEGFSCWSGTLELPGGLALEPGDRITVQDLSGAAFSLPVMGVSSQYSVGGIRTTVTASATAETDPETGYTGPVTAQVREISRRLSGQDGAFTQLRQTVHEIELKAVGEDDVISIINASPEQIRLQSNRLLVESDNFTLTEDGTVSANAGNFGAFEIDGDAIRCENGELVMRLNSVGSDSYLTPLQFGYWDETWGYNGSTVAELAFYTGSPNCIGLRIWEDGTAGTGSSLYLDMNGKAELYAGQFLVSPPNPIVGQGQPFQVDTDSNAVSIGGTLKVGGRTYGVNQTLWSGATYPTASQTITFANAISAQPNGAVLVWSDYDTENSAAGNYGWCFSFVPKGFVLAHSGAGSSEFSKPYRGMWKRVFLSDTSLTGYDENQNAGTNNGIAYNNAKFVLRYVIGV